MRKYPEFFKNFFQKLFLCIRERRLPWRVENFLVPIKVFPLIIFHSYTWKYAVIWLRSLRYRHSAFSEKIPWINFKAITWLESYLKPGMSVFEYGSGGSTVFIAGRVKSLVSVEHDRAWYIRIKELLAAERVSNAEPLLFEPEKIATQPMTSYGCDSYASTVLPGLSFEKYVKSIEAYPDKSFDLVFIDGRARASCIKHAIKKVRDAGYIMVDNSERQIYNEAFVLLADYKRQNFIGFGPGSTDLCRTSIWQLKKDETKND